MQFVELETQTGKIWVNPAHVVTVSVSPNRNALTDLHLIDHGGKAITIKGTLAEIAKVLNDALKA